MANPFVGEIRLVGFNFAPIGWAFCAGQLLPISQNDFLFTLIGTTYGGDGQNTFALPDLRSRVPVHIGGGLIQGQNGGVEAVTLKEAQIPSHTHRPNCNTTSANSTTPDKNYWGTWADAQYSDGASDSQLNPGAVGGAGGSQPHDNMVPFLALNFIIALEGVFPSQG